MYRIPLIKNAFYNEKETRRKLAEFIISGKQLSMGEKCQEFEQEFSKVQGRKYSVLFNSGGSANLALLQTMKNIGTIKTGDNVGFSALTWSTNVMPIIELSMSPVPFDIDILTLNVASDQTLVDNLHNISALFITNALGFMPHYSIIKEICEVHGIVLIEDNCEALGSESFFVKSGNAGLASTFSFYVAHHLSTIEGGMVCTDDYELYNMLKLVRANGWDRNLDKDVQKEMRDNFKVDGFYSKYTFYDLGYNLRPTEITGFLGLEQLKYLPKIIKRREFNYSLLASEIKRNDDIIPMYVDYMSVVSSFAIPFIFRNHILKDKYLKKFEEAGIETRPIIAGDITNQPFWKKYIKEDYRLINASIVSNNGFYCGNYPEMTTKDLQIIMECIKK